MAAQSAQTGKWERTKCTLVEFIIRIGAQMVFLCHQCVKTGMALLTLETPMTPIVVGQQHLIAKSLTTILTFIQLGLPGNFISG